MADTTAPYGRKTQKEPAVKEVHVLWITAGLSCDGDSVSITAATQPSIEDVVLGAIPGLPKVHLHNPVLAYEVGDEFMKLLVRGRRGPARRPFVLVVEGSIPNEKIKSEGYWAALGHRQEDRPADHHLRMDRPPGAQGVGRGRRPAPAPPTAASTPWPATRPAAWAWPTTSAGTGSPRPACPIVNVPGCPVQPDNFTETLLYLLYQVAGLAPMIPLDEAAAADLAVRQDRPRRLRPGRLLRAGRLRPRVRLAQMPGEDRLLGAGGQLQRHQARLDGRHRRLSQRRRHLHRLHHARLPRQVHAVHGRAARRRAVLDAHRHVRPGDPRPARPHQRHRQQGAEMAASRPRTDDRVSSYDVWRNRRDPVSRDRRTRAETLWSR